MLPAEKRRGDRRLAGNRARRGVRPRVTQRGNGGTPPTPRPRDGDQAIDDGPREQRGRGFSLPVRGTGLSIHRPPAHGSSVRLRRARQACILVTEGLGGGTIWHRSVDRGFSGKRHVPSAPMAWWGWKKAHKRGIPRRGMNSECGSSPGEDGEGDPLRHLPDSSARATPWRPGTASSPAPWPVWPSGSPGGESDALACGANATAIQQKRGSSCALAADMLGVLGLWHRFDRGSRSQN